MAKRDLFGNKDEKGGVKEVSMPKKSPHLTRVHQAAMPDGANRTLDAKDARIMADLEESVAHPSEQSKKRT